MGRKPIPTCIDWQKAMDFSLVPHRSALVRLGHLLPIDPFLRLKCVQPLLTGDEPTRRFPKIMTNRPEDGPLQLTFGPAVKEYTITYMTPEAVWNGGAVECDKLTLFRADGVPFTAIECRYDLTFDVAEPRILPFLAKAPAEVTFIGTMRRQNSLTLKEVCGHLGPNVVRLDFPLRAFPDGNDVASWRLTRRPSKSLQLLKLSVPMPADMVEWLRINASILAYGDLCEEVSVKCYGDFKHYDHWLATATKVVHPYCQHHVERGRRLRVEIYGKATFFSFIPDCHRCKSVSSND